MMLHNQVPVLLIGAVLAVASPLQDDGALLRVAKQAHAKGALHDQSSAETGFGGGGGVEHSKYFHYQHLPEHDKYEFGYRRGNDHHVRERYEKAVPHEGHFKTKVRWADKKGGHGEHYWDYNHAGHHDDGEGGYSDPVPSYTDSQRASSSNLKVHQKRQLEPEPSIEPIRQHFNEPIRRQFNDDIAQPDQRPQPSQDFYNVQEAQERDGFVQSFEEEIGGIANFEIQKESAKQKRAPEGLKTEGERTLPQVSQPEIRSQRPVQESRSQKQPVEPQRQASEPQRTVRPAQPAPRAATPQLFFDLESGRVIDESTGKTYVLQLV